MWCLIGRYSLKKSSGLCRLLCLNNPTRHNLLLFILPIKIIDWLRLVREGRTKQGSKQPCLRWSKEFHGPSGPLEAHPHHPCPSPLSTHHPCPSPLPTPITLTHYPSEDDALQQLHIAAPPGKEGRTWPALAKAMPSRTGRQCRDRW